MSLEIKRHNIDVKTFFRSASRYLDERKRRELSYFIYLRFFSAAGSMRPLNAMYIALTSDKYTAIQA